MEMERKKGLETLWASSRYVSGRNGGPRSTSGDVGRRLSYQCFFCSISPHPTQGSYLIYPESEAVSFSDPQISRGIPHRIGPSSSQSEYML